MENGKKRRKNKGTESGETHRLAKGVGRGVRLNSQAKRIVENVRDFFDNDKKRKVIVSPSRSFLALLRPLEYPRCLSSGYTKVLYLAQDCKFLTPVKRYSISRIRVNPDSFS